MLGTQTHPAWIHEVAPDIDGPAAKLWRLRFDKDAPGTGLGDIWLAFAPGAHPFWSYHTIAAVSLADTPGVPPAHKQFGTAAYEFMCLALHPEHCELLPHPSVPVTPGALPVMMPPDAVVQVGPLPKGDEGAVEILDLIARAVADGMLVPDSDHAQRWESAIWATVDHAHGRHD